MEKKVSIILFLLLFNILYSTGCFSQTRLGLSFTKEEVEIWKERAEKGPYKTFGDAGLNTPGDWDRILKDADALVKDPSSDFYTGPLFDKNGSPIPENAPIPTWSQPEPRGAGLKTLNCAFVYLVKQDKKYLDAAKAALIYQIRDPRLDFSNSKRWVSLSDVNPGFMIAEWVNRLLIAYDYLQISDPAIDKWFNSAALYFQIHFEKGLNSLYKDRPNGIIADITSAQKFVKETHVGGFQIPVFSLHYNNRKGDFARLLAYTGVKYNNKSFINSAKMYFKEFIKYSTFPDGTLAEFERALTTLPDQGFAYATAFANIMLETADVLARAGDNSLYEYTTSDGIATTKGGQKNIKLILRNLSGFVDSSINRYAIHKNHQDNKIDGIVVSKNWYSVNDIWFSQGNVYFKDDYIKNVYTRRAKGTIPYPKSPAASGPVPVWVGSGAICPGKLFMYGQMEHLVNPFKGLQKPINKIPIVKTNADLTIKMSDKVAVLGSTGSDEDGTIVRYQWSKISGGPVTMEDYTSPILRLYNFEEGEYIFKVTVVDNDGGTASDDIKLIVLKNLQPSVFAGNDKTIDIETPSLTLVGIADDVDGKIKSLEWVKISGPDVTLEKTKSSSLTVSKFKEGTLIFRLIAVDDDGGSSYDDVTIYVTRKAIPHVSAGEDIVISIETPSLKLSCIASDPEFRFKEYRWNKELGGDVSILTNNAPEITISNYEIGEYFFKVTVKDSFGQESFDIVKVTVLPTPLHAFLVKSRASCFGLNNGAAEVAVKGGYSPYAIKWSNGGIGNKQEDLKPGNYTVFIVDSKNTTFTLAVNIDEFSPMKIVVDANAEISSKKNGSINLTVSGGLPPYIVKWSNGEAVEDIFNLSAGRYIVEVKDQNGCLNIKEIDVGLQLDNDKDDNTKLSLNPRKVFSPNGDGLGDEMWVIENVEKIQGCNLTIFSEGGKKVFETVSYNNNWNGMFNGKEAPEGAYFYLISCPDSNEKITGALKLIR